MKASLNNFLYFIKQIVTGHDGTNGNDGGIQVDRPLNVAADLRTTAGLTLTASTTPAVLLTETNGMTIALAASSDAGGTFTFQVPRDYDESSDIFKLRIMAGTDGTTDAPTLSATVYKKQAGQNLTADLGSVASVALADATAWVTVDISGKGLVRDDVLTINIVSTAHTTDAISIHAVDPVYASTIVSYDETDTGNPMTGNLLR